jgi:hypothetical protein
MQGCQIAPHDKNEMTVMLSLHCSSSRRVQDYSSPRQSSAKTLAIDSRRNVTHVRIRSSNW